jgi:hypothetical protein
MLSNTNSKAKQGKSNNAKALADLASKQKSNKPRRVKNQVGLSRGLTAILDPFSIDAYGAKLPDQSSYPSLPFTVKSIQSGATSAATGADCSAFIPFGSYYRSNPTGLSAAGIMTWTPATDGYAPATNWSSYQAAMGLYRTVTGGIKIDVTSSLLNTQGRLYVCHVPMDEQQFAGGANYFPTTVGGIMNMPLSEEYSLAELTEEELIIPFRRFSIQSENYRDSAVPVAAGIEAAAATESTFGWCAIILLFVGASLTNPVSYDVEHILHCEGLQLGNDTILAETPAAPFIPQAMAQIYQLNQAMPVGSITKDPQQGTWVDNALSKAKKVMVTTSKVAGFALEAASLFV